MFCFWVEMSSFVRGFGKQCVQTRGSLGSVANTESFAYYCYVLFDVQCSAVCFACNLCRVSSPSTLYWHRKTPLNTYYSQQSKLMLLTAGKSYFMSKFADWSPSPDRHCVTYPTSAHVDLHTNCWAWWWCVECFHCIGSQRLSIVIRTFIAV